MNKIETPTILVIIGISGDLAKRKLLPAIRQIASAGILPEKFRIIGITRRDVSIDDILPSGDTAFLREVLELKQMDLTDPAAYTELQTYLENLEAGYGETSQRLFYLSVPPQAAEPVIGQLGEAGFARVPATKLLLEKPFGMDLTSARDLIAYTQTYFAEDMVYRIDHYLAKEMAQNLIIFRSGNSLFKRTWNSDFIESIEIMVSEDIGIENRATFYEQTGALRDVVQSHLMQLAALMLMELPENDDWQTIPAKRLQALQDIEVPQDIASCAVRAQYDSYRQEVGNPTSTVETFVSLCLSSKNPRWKGMPIKLITGKSLDRQATEIRIHYKKEHAEEANTLTLRIHPNEGLAFNLWAKQPGYERKLQNVSLDFSYSNHFDTIPDAYGRVFVDAMRCDHSLFTTSDEVLASWRILEPVLYAWDMGNDPLTVYPSGTNPLDIS